MYDYFLSYAHLAADEAFALRDHLVARGRSVWVDESRTDADFLGVPFGSQHEVVIDSAIDESACFLISLSPQWLASEYCQSELRTARSLGKRVAVLGDEGVVGPCLVTADVGPCLVTSDPDELDVRLQARADVALAHLRLERLRNDRDTEQSSWLERLVQRDPAARDAELILTAEPGADAPEITAGLTEFATGVLATARAHQRRRSRFGIGLLAVLGVLALVAVVASIRAVEFAASAAASERHARALNLAGESRHAVTPESLPLAEQAWELEPTAATRAALSLARAQHRLVQLSHVPPRYYLTATVAGEFVVAADNRSLVVLDHEGSFRWEIRPPGARMRHSPLVAGNGRTVYAMERGKSILTVNVMTGATSSQWVENVTVIAFHDGELWAATRDGRLLRGSSVSELQPVRTDLGEVTGLEVTGEVITVVVGSRELVRIPYATPQAPGVRQPINPEAEGVVPALATDSRPTRRIVAFNSVDPERYDQVRTCGSTTHVLLGPRHLFNFTHHIAVNPSGEVVVPMSRSTELSSVACVGEGLVGIGPLGDSFFTSTPDLWVPARLVSPAARAGSSAVTGLPDGRLITVSHDGLARLEGRTAAQSRELGAAVSIAPLGRDGILAVDGDSNLFSLVPGKSVRTLGRFEGVPRLGVPIDDRRVLSGDARLLLVGVRGPEQQWTLPRTANSVSVGANRDLVVTFDGEGWSYPLAGGDPHRTPLPAGELVKDVHAQGTIAETETKLIRFDPATGTVEASVDLQPGTFVADLPREGSGIVTLASGGRLRTYGPDLTPGATRDVGSTGSVLSTTRNPERILVFRQGDVLTLTPDTLEERERIPNAGQKYATTDNQLVAFQPYRAGSEATGRGEGEEPAVIEFIPLCPSCAPE